MRKPIITREPSPDDDNIRENKFYGTIKAPEDAGDRTARTFGFQWDDPSE